MSTSVSASSSASAAPIGGGTQRSSGEDVIAHWAKDSAFQHHRQAHPGKQRLEGETKTPELSTALAIVHPKGDRGKFVVEVTGSVVIGQEKYPILTIGSRPEGGTAYESVTGPFLRWDGEPLPSQKLGDSALDTQETLSKQSESLKEQYDLLEEAYSRAGAQPESKARSVVDKAKQLLKRPRDATSLVDATAAQLRSSYLGYAASILCQVLPGDLGVSYEKVKVATDKAVLREDKQLKKFASETPELVSKVTIDDWRRGYHRFLSAHSTDQERKKCEASLADRCDVDSEVLRSVADRIRSRMTRSIQSAWGTSAEFPSDFGALTKLTSDAPQGGFNLEAEMNDLQAELDLAGSRQSFCNTVVSRAESEGRMTESGRASTREQRKAELRRLTLEGLSGLESNTDLKDRFQLLNYNEADRAGTLKELHQIPAKDPSFDFEVFQKTEALWSEWLAKSMASRSSRAGSTSAWSAWRSRRGKDIARALSDMPSIVEE